MNVYYQTMDEITTLIKISKKYHICGKYFRESIIVIDEGVEYYTFHNEHYDKHYRICYKAATNFINKSNVFSELKPEEIIKVFAKIEFKDNRILFDSKLISVNIIIRELKLFKELLRINKEMLLALIKAINDKKITHRIFYYFTDENGVLGARSDINDDIMIRLYRILLEYNNFSLDNLNIKNILNDIRPSITKRAI